MELNGNKPGLFIKTGWQMNRKTNNAFLRGWQVGKNAVPTANPQETAIFRRVGKVAGLSPANLLSNPRFSAGLAVGRVGTPKGVASERQPLGRNHAVSKERTGA